MKVKITLSNTGGVLDHRVVNAEDEDDPVILEAAQEILDQLTYLSVGDALTVERVS